MNAQKQTNPLSTCTSEPGRALCDVAQASAAAFAALSPRDQGNPPISLLKILHWYRTASQRSRQRKQLLEMDARQLKDIGISRYQAEQEARKPIWKD